MVGYAGTWKEISLPRTSVPVIYSTTLRTNELDNIPTTRLDLRVPGKKYYYLVRNLTTIDRFTTTPAIEQYSSRAPTETSGLSFMDLSLSRVSLLQLLYMLSQKKLVHNKLDKDGFFDRGGSFSNHKKMQKCEFLTLLLKVHCLRQVIMCISYVQVI